MGDHPGQIASARTSAMVAMLAAGNPTGAVLYRRPLAVSTSVFQSFPYSWDEGPSTAPLGFAHSGAWHSARSVLAFLLVWSKADARRTARPGLSTLAAIGSKRTSYVLRWLELARTV